MTDDDWDEATSVNVVVAADTIPCPPPTEPAACVAPLASPSWCECEEWGQPVAMPCASGTCPTVRERITKGLS